MSHSTVSSYPLFDTFGFKKKVPVVLQTEAAECGLACLTMVAQHYGDKRELSELRQDASLSLRGATLKNIMEMAHRLGLQSRALKIEMASLSQLSCPAILHWDMQHFVVLTTVTRNSIVIIDPSLGKRTLTLHEAAMHVSGIALEIAPTDTFTPKPARTALKLRHFLTKATGFKRNILTLIGLSALLQIFALISPYYMQTIVDDVIIQGNHALLKALAIGFFLLLVIETFTSTVRRLLILSASSRLQLQLSASVLQHLLSLPIDYFAKRHVGDLVSRFGSLAKIREFLTTGLVTALLDGVMAIVTLSVMAIYSIKLTLVVIVIMLIYLAIRVALIPVSKRLTTEKIALGASEQSHFMESMRAITPIRVYQQEVKRHSQWQNKLVLALNKEISLGKLRLSSDAINQILFGIENLIVIYIAATLVIDNTLTVGMMLAFIAYKTRFISALDSVVNTFIELSMLGVHFARLSDIVFAKPATPRRNLMAGTQVLFTSSSPSAVMSSHSFAPCALALEARGLNYAYSENCPPVLRNINLQVAYGDIIAIVGESGGGKSTLLKCLMGLYTPTSGFIRHGSDDASGLPVIASVLQDDACLSGSIADNISCFDETLDHERLIHSAQIACIHHEIITMPMQYQTLVGDMGNSLSGGQKQRLLLARALYQQPSILFLDEASSNLDIENERKINQHLKALNITRIMVAHRPQTIAMANKVFELQEGALCPLTNKSTLTTPI